VATRKYDKDGMPIMTKREQELDILVRKLRRVVFSDDTKYAEKAARVLKKAMYRLNPYNYDRMYELNRKAGDRYMRMME
jgi:Leu/Phe-tRNA-protein transferase